MPYLLGLDVGTTWTAAAVWQYGRAGTLPLGQYSDAVPSAVFLRPDGTFAVGEEALPLGAVDPSRLAREFKARLGDTVPLLLGGHPVHAEVLTGMLIRAAILRAVEVMGGPPDGVCLTVPATWGPHRRDCMQFAAQHAGLAGAELVAEPVAAASHYALHQQFPLGALIAVFDLGGGTFDAALLRRTRDGFALAGRPVGLDDVGGISFDDAVLGLVRATVGPDLDGIGDPLVLDGLRSDVTDAKEALTEDAEAFVTVVLPAAVRSVAAAGSVTRTHVVRLTRGAFERAIRPEVQRTVDVFAGLLRREGVSPGQCTVLTVGGSSQVPLVRELLGNSLGVLPNPGTDPSYAVCLGAAITAAGVTGLTDEPNPEETLRREDVPFPPPPQDGPTARPAAGTLSPALTRTLIAIAALTLAALAVLALTT